MSGLLTITVQEERGAVAIPADLYKLSVVMGCASLRSALNVSLFYMSDTAAIAAEGYGDAVDALCQIIKQRLGDGSSSAVPAAMCAVPPSTVGAHGTIDTTGVHGTAVPTVDASTAPVGTFDARVRVSVGGTVGTAGITYQTTLDGLTWTSSVALGTATTITIPNSGVVFSLTATTTLLEGDVIKLATTAPAPVAADVDAAFVALANSSLNFSWIVLEFPMTRALIAHVTTGLNTCLSRGKRVKAIGRFRVRNANETEADWAAAAAAEFAGYNDSRIHIRSGYGLLTDAVTSRQYIRNDLAQVAADIMRTGRTTWFDSPADRAMPNYSLVNAAGADVGHDEGPRGAVSGLSNQTQGNRLGCVQRLPNPNRREEVYTTVPWVLFAPDEKIRTVMARRTIDDMATAAVEAGTPILGATTFFIPADPNKPGSRPMLTPASCNSIHAKIYQAVSVEFAGEIENANDASNETGLIQISPYVTVTDTELISVSGKVAPKIAGHVTSVAFSIAVQ
jgi:hypothetical protein